MDPAGKVYTIGDKSYRFDASLSWQQGDWLRQQQVFAGIDLRNSTGYDIEQLLIVHGPMLLGICLLEEGQTRKQQKEAGFAAAQALAEEIKGVCTPAEVQAMGRDFFTQIPFENLWQCVSWPKPPALPPSSTGSPQPSASSPAAISSAAPSS